MAVMKQLAIALPVEPPPSLTGASAHDTDSWHDIDWRQVSGNVRRLQARIVKATQEGRWGKMKAFGLPRPVNARQLKNCVKMAIGHNRDAASTCPRKKEKDRLVFP